MNKNERKTANTLLEKIQGAKPEEVAQYSTAYQALTQGAVNRANAQRSRRYARNK